jgi:hypothetical protein
MKDQLIDEAVARRFLLGQLPPEEQGRIEELAFEDVDTFAFLETVEDDLIDEFIQGDLSAEEKLRFENHFLSLPGRRNNLQVSRALQRHLDTIKIRDRKGFSIRAWFDLKPWWFRLALTATAAVLLVIIAIWIYVRAREVTHPAPLQAGPAKPTAKPSPEFKVSPLVEPTTSPVHAENKPKNLAPERQKKSATYALLSPSAAVRGEGGVQHLRVPPGASSMTVELALITERNFRKYEAVLENEAGTVLKRWSNLKAEQLTSGRALKIMVPAALLKHEEFYRMIVSGVTAKGETEVVAQYPFEVSK